MTISEMGFWLDALKHLLSYNAPNPISRANMKDLDLISLIDDIFHYPNLITADDIRNDLSDAVTDCVVDYGDDC